MFTKKFISLAILAVGATLIISGCSSTEQNQSNSSTPDENTQQTAELRDTGDNKTTVYFFWGDGCPHCAKAKPWLRSLEQQTSNLEVKMLETWNDQDNAQLFQEMAKSYGTQARGVPAIFVGDFKPIIGFNENKKTEIRNKIQTCLNQGCEDPGSKL